MTKRCKHEFETKDGYPDDILCQKCQTIWAISDYMDWTARQAMTLPLVVRRAVLKRQADIFARDNPDYYSGAMKKKGRTMNIYQQALEVWGQESQLGMVQEECAELIKVINKYWRGKAGKDDVVEECVDVELMINQMKELFADERNTWDRIKMVKIERLNELLRGNEIEV